MASSDLTVEQRMTRVEDAFRAYVLMSYSTPEMLLRKQQTAIFARVVFDFFQDIAKER